MAKGSFSPIRKALAKHDRAALISLIGELYAIHQQNRHFLEARFLQNQSGLASYKRIIRGALFPDLSDPVSFRDAKKAISDYQKALGDPEGMAELLVFGAECGNAFTCDYGDIGEAFYDSLIRLFESAVKAVATLDERTAKPFVFRLRQVVEKAHGIGWGYYDAIGEIFGRTFPHATDD